jgi:hypothetical protein
MRIAEDVAIYALSPPLVTELWAHPEIISRKSLQVALKRKPNAPLTRFRRICSRLETVPFPDVNAWSEAIGKSHRLDPAEGNDLKPPKRNRRFFGWRPPDVSAVFRSDLLKQDTVGLIHALAKQIGLINGRPIKLLSDSLADPSPDSLLEAFARFEVTHNFDLKLDRYSQVCVLGTSQPARELVLHSTELPELMSALSGNAYLIVTAGLVRGDRVRFNRSFHPVGHVTLTGPYSAEDSDGYKLSPTAHVQVRTAREFLTQFGRWDMASKPVLASSTGYDFGEGDYKGIDLLRNIPHVVVSIRDFRSLWMSLGRKKGLRGCRNIEWRAMPSPSGRKYFGFLLFKPADNPFPIVVNPSVVYYHERTITGRSTYRQQQFSW